VVAAAGLIGVASPAFADAALSGISLEPETVQAGQQTIVHFTVTITGGVSVDIGVTSNNPKVTCAGTCHWSGVNSPNVKDYSATFKTSPNFTADTQVTLTVTAGSASSPQTLNVIAPEAPPSVPLISGTVVNIYDAKPVNAAKVFAQDSATPPHLWETGTDKNVFSRSSRRRTSPSLRARSRSSSARTAGPSTRARSRHSPVSLRTTSASR
jgi:hypothetical protein